MINDIILPHNANGPDINIPKGRSLKNCIAFLILFLCFLIYFPVHLPHYRTPDIYIYSS